MSNFPALVHVKTNKTEHNHNRLNKRTPQHTPNSPTNFQVKENNNKQILNQNEGR
jgi:hypothetical protein